MNVEQTNHLQTVGICEYLDEIVDLMSLQIMVERSYTAPAGNC